MRVHVYEDGGGREGGGLGSTYVVIGWLSTGKQGRRNPFRIPIIVGSELKASREITCANEPYCFFVFLFFAFLGLHRLMGRLCLTQSDLSSYIVVKDFTVMGRE